MQIFHRSNKQQQQQLTILKKMVEKQAPNEQRTTMDVVNFEAADSWGTWLDSNDDNEPSMAKDDSERTNRTWGLDESESSLDGPTTSSSSPRSLLEESLAMEKDNKVHQTWRDSLDDEAAAARNDVKTTKSDPERERRSRKLAGGRPFPFKLHKSNTKGPAGPSFRIPSKTTLLSTPRSSAPATSSTQRLSAPVRAPAPRLSAPPQRLSAPPTPQPRPLLQQRRQRQFQQRENPHHQKDPWFNEAMFSAGVDAQGFARKNDGLRRTATKSKVRAKRAPTLQQATTTTTTTTTTTRENKAPHDKTDFFFNQLLLEEEPVNNKRRPLVLRNNSLDAKMKNLPREPSVASCEVSVAGSRSHRRAASLDSMDSMAPHPESIRKMAQLVIPTKSSWGGDDESIQSLRVLQVEF